MGTWGTGPFDNDAAADFAVGLDEAEPARRVEMVCAVLVPPSSTVLDVERPA